MVKNWAANAGDTRDMAFIPESGRSPRVGNGNLLQYTCLENSMDRGAWQATVHGAAMSQTGLSDRAHMNTIYKTDVSTCSRPPLLPSQLKLPKATSVTVWSKDFLILPNRRITASTQILCVSHCSKHSIYIISFYIHNSS